MPAAARADGDAVERPKAHRASGSLVAGTQHTRNACRMLADKTGSGWGWHHGEVRDANGNAAWRAGYRRATNARARLLTSVARGDAHGQTEANAALIHLTGRDARECAHVLEI